MYDFKCLFGYSAAVFGSNHKEEAIFWSKLIAWRIDSHFVFCLIKCETVYTLIFSICIRWEVAFHPTNWVRCKVHPWNDSWICTAVIGQWGKIVAVSVNYEIIGCDFRADNRGVFICTSWSVTGASLTQKRLRQERLALREAFCATTSWGKQSIVNWSMRDTKFCCLRRQNDVKIKKA